VSGGDPLPPSEPDDDGLKKKKSAPPPQPTPIIPTITEMPPPEQETPITSTPPVGTTRTRTQTQRTEAEKPKQQAEKPKDEDYKIVPIFYGTDRARTGKKEPKDFYGAERGKLELGTCEVSIPKTHVRGQLEAPSIWRLEFKEDPKRHVVLLSVKPLDAGEFNSQFQTSLGAAKSRDVLVFVHGYNVKFVDAARRTAQLAYDLEFPGVPVLYSWPSQGSLSGYTVDEAAVERTEPHLKKFLADLAAQAGGARIHLIAHSMGNRALTKVMRELAHENTTPLFSEVILTAPDIDAEVFEQQLAPAIQKIARHVTLYASSSDAALLASKKVHGHQRAGDSLPEIIVVPGIDTIDASGIDTDMLGHSYFAQMKDVMDDMNLLMIAGKLPPERSLLEQIRGAGKYWRLPATIVMQDGQRPSSIPGAKFLTVRNALLLAALFVAFVAIAVWLVLRARRRRAVAA
jgi:esterase/lipase superfamily enzyme